jgi:hypothetical protein
VYVRSINSGSMENAGGLWSSSEDYTEEVVYEQNFNGSL